MDKDKIIFTCITIIIIAFIILIDIICTTGCQSTTRPIDRTEQQLIREFAKFEESFESIDKRIERSQTIASTISDEIERAIYLFRQYDDAIREMRAEFDRYVHKAQEETTN